MRLDAMIERLRANADVLAALTVGVGDDQARWKPSPSEWSILEVVWHVADEEVEDFRARLDATLHRPGEPWAPIDPPRAVVERAYNDRTLSEGLDAFLTRRRSSLRWLEGLTDPDWTLAYEHPSAGSISAGDLLTSWVAHDHIHVRQLNRLHRAYLVSEVSSHSPAYAGRW